MPARISLPRICVALGFPDARKLLQHAEGEVDAGETFLEFRLDYLPHPEEGFQVIRDLLARHPEVTVLATCRRHQNHGKFNGSIEEQIRVLDGAVSAGAKAVDLEIESAESISARLEPLRGRTLLILSYHNFETTPNMDAVYRRMTVIPADAYKIVTQARKPSDIQRVLALGRAHTRTPLVLLAMGETGFPSRVLSSTAGGLYTYAAPRTAEGTAAGQVSGRMLRQTYRVEKFTRDASIFGVIADPVWHSISPAVHNRAFQAKRIDAVYVPFLVHPAQLKDFMGLGSSLPISGFSVTIPHKQKIIRYLDQVDPLARRIGAVNTVVRKARKWRGTNTDVDGVLVPLGKHLKLNRSSVLVVGNGGAARGAAFALADAGAKVSITGRNPDRIRALAKICGAQPVARESLAAERFDALVHATPLGMSPNVNSCFFDGTVPAELVFDMVYNPMETALLKLARDRGKTVIPGIQMFVEQAVRQFEIFTGDSAPRAAMERAALAALSQNHKAAGEQ